MRNPSADIPSPPTSRWRIGVAMALASGALVFASCGGDSTESSSSGGGNSSGSEGGSATKAALKTEVSEERFQEFLDLSFGPETVTKDDLPRIAVDAMKIGAQPLTPEEKAKLSECLDKTTCDTGRGELTVGIAESGGAILWRQEWRAQATLQLLRYPQVKKIIFTDASDDLQKALSNFRSLVSQGSDVIIGNMNYADAMLPVIRDAAKRDIEVIPGPNAAPSATGQGDIAADITVDLCEYGNNFADALIGVKAHESVALYTGVPGNPIGAAWIPCAEKKIKEAGGEVMLKGTTDWTPQGSQQAASALLSRGIPTGLAYDYTPNAFNDRLLKAKKAPPAQVVASVDYAFYQQWLDAGKTPQAFDAFISASQLGLTWTQVSMAVEKALGQGEDIPLHVKLPNPVVDAKKYEAQYDPSLPTGISFNSGLPDDVLASLG